MNRTDQSSDVRFELLILKPHHILRFKIALNLRRTKLQRNIADEVDVNIGIVNAVKRRFEVAGECRFKEAVLKFRDVMLWRSFTSPEINGVEVEFQRLITLKKGKCKG
ncbi:hypothetical protein Hanom_Chr02g00134271 [Helianthus anomalus]